MGTVCGAPLFWWFETNKLFVLLEFFPVPWKLHIEGELATFLLSYLLWELLHSDESEEAALANN